MDDTSAKVASFREYIDNVLFGIPEPVPVEPGRRSGSIQYKADPDYETELRFDQATDGSIQMTYRRWPKHLQHATFEGWESRRGAGHAQSP